MHQNPMNSLRYEKMRSEFAKVGLVIRRCESFRIVAYGDKCRLASGSLQDMSGLRGKPFLPNGLQVVSGMT